jgi:hemerythrin-like domain-containing protein
MIRHDAIAELSRDHHQALFQAMALKRATDENHGQVAADFVRFFDEHANRHFEIEEQVLLPEWAVLAGIEQTVDPIVTQMLREHVELRAMVRLLRAGDIDLAFVREVGQRLDAHVRHEERKVFPMIQQSLTDDQLQLLAQQMRVADGRN